MVSFSRWILAAAAVVLLGGTAVADDAIATGKIKDVNSERKAFIVTDRAGKDWTFKFGDHVVINRGGKEGKSELNANDRVHVYYDKGALKSTALYILVLEGATRNWELLQGIFKGYDASKKQFSLTDGTGKEKTFPLGSARVRLNKEDIKVGDIKAGHRTLVIVERNGDTTTLKGVMIELH
jgi:hypothetical protein